MNEVYMNVPAVQNVAKILATVSEVLTNVVKVLDMLITTLRATAFIGAVGGAAVAQFLEAIKPEIEEKAERTAELSRDVTASVEAFERGDEQGATRFY